MPAWKASFFTLSYIALALFIITFGYGTALNTDEDFALSSGELHAVGAATFAALMAGLFEQRLFRRVLLQGFPSGISVAYMSPGSLHSLGKDQETPLSKPSDTTG